MIYRFGTFALDLDRFELSDNGEPVPVEPQVFAVLALLVAHHDRMVTKDEIHERIWNGRIVSDAALNSRIRSARQAVGDDGKSQRVIRTLRGNGFRFVAEVSQEAPGRVPLPFRTRRPGRPHPAGRQIRGRGSRCCPSRTCRAIPSMSTFPPRYPATSSRL